MPVRTLYHSTAHEDPLNDLIREVVDAVCGLLSITPHHYDVSQGIMYESDPPLDLEQAWCVIYDRPYGNWQAAVNIDGTITWPAKKTQTLAFKLIAELTARGIKENVNT